MAPSGGLKLNPTVLPGPNVLRSPVTGATEPSTNRLPDKVLPSTRKPRNVMKPTKLVSVSRAIAVAEAAAPGQKAAIPA